ncbi:MAG: energy transducer TonB [Sphingomonas sp.]
MKHRFFSAVIVSSIITAAAQAASPEPETLAPSSAWNVNYSDEACRLARVFGTGDAMTFVVFDKFGPGQSFKLTLGGKRFRYLSGGGQASVRFGPDEAGQMRDYFTGDYNKSMPALILRGDMRMDKLPDRLRQGGKEVPPEEAPPLAPARVAAVRELVIGRPLRKSVKFALGSMRAPAAALDKCIEKLMTNWGIDVARHATLSRRALPTGSPTTWLVSSDYPAGARFMGLQGIVNFRLSVDESGMPSACHIQQSSHPPEFDAALCSGMMRRARFTPALDKDGKPLASYFRGTAVFKMG